MRLRLIAVLLTFSVVHSSVARVLSPKVKAIGLNAAYGSVGGALLGVSSLAFGAKGRVVAKGASLGLYFGLAFGAYVVMTHGRQYGGHGEDGSDGGGYSPNNNLYEGGGGFFRGDEVNNYGHPLEDIHGGTDISLRFFQYRF